MTRLVDRPLLFFAVTLVLFLGSTTVGVLARTHGHKLTSAERAEFDLVRNAMFTLFGLIVGFATAMAVSRYDLRKELEESEANAIGTEYVRLDFMPAEAAATARALLKTYVDERIVYYESRAPGVEDANAAETAKTMNALWAAIAPSVNADQTVVAALVASGMNDVLNS